MKKDQRVLFLTLVPIVVTLAALQAGCPRQSTSAKFPDPKTRFANYTQTCGGIPGYLPDHYGYYLTDAQKSGACTWYLWPGGDALRTQGSPENARGNPRFWRLAEKKLWLISNVLDIPVDVSMLRYITEHAPGTAVSEARSDQRPRMQEVGSSGPLRPQSRYLHRSVLERHHGSAPLPESGFQSRSLGCG